MYSYLLVFLSMHQLEDFCKVWIYLRSPLQVYILLYFIIIQKYKLKKMNKLNLILLALAFLTLPALTQTIFNRRLSSTCCAACPQFAVAPSVVLLTKYQMSIVNVLSSNSTVSNLLSFLRKFPFSWTPSLYQEIDDVSFKNSSNFISRGGVDTKSYAAVDQGTINFLLNATKGVIDADLANNSFNFRNTASNFIQTIRTNYNSMLQSTISAGTLIDGTSVSTANLNSFTMSLTMKFISTLTNQEQQAIFNCVSYINSKASSYPGLAQKFGVLWQLPIEDEYYDQIIQTYDSSFISNSNKSYFFKKASYPALYCPIASQIDGIVNNSSRRLTDSNSTGTVQIPTYNIMFQRRSLNQPSTFDPIFMDLYNGLTFDGSIYNPSNEDLSVLPNGGFGPSQTPYSIWNKLENKVFGSSLFYKLPGVKEAIQQTCPMTCDHSC